MGLIRKTLAVGTIGIVHGSSKKQRVAKQTLDVQRAILSELQGTVRMSNAETAAAHQRYEARQRQRAIEAAAAKGQDTRPFWER